MKKFFALFLTAAMIFSLAACGSSASSQSAEASGEIPQPAGESRGLQRTVHQSVARDAGFDHGEKRTHRILKIIYNNWEKLKPLPESLLQHDPADILCKDTRLDRNWFMLKQLLDESH